MSFLKDKFPGVLSMPPPSAKSLGKTYIAYHRQHVPETLLLRRCHLPHLSMLAVSWVQPTCKWRYFGKTTIKLIRLGELAHKASWTLCVDICDRAPLERRTIYGDGWGSARMGSSEDARPNVDTPAVTGSTVNGHGRSSMSKIIARQPHLDRLSYTMQVLRGTGPSGD